MRLLTRGGWWLSFPPAVREALQQGAFDRQFWRTAKFYADENLEPVIVEILRDFGLDVSTAADAELIRRDDRDHLAFAKREDRSLLTRDDGFFDDCEHPPHRCPGVVVIDVGAPTRTGLEQMIFLLKVVVTPYREI